MTPPPMTTACALVLNLIAPQGVIFYLKPFLFVFEKNLNSRHEKATILEIMVKLSPSKTGAANSY